MSRNVDDDEFEVRYGDESVQRFADSLQIRDLPPVSWKRARLPLYNEGQLAFRLRKKQDAAAAVIQLAIRKRQAKRKRQQEYENKEAMKLRSKRVFPRFLPKAEQMRKRRLARAERLRQTNHEVMIAKSELDDAKLMLQVLNKKWYRWTKEEMRPFDYATRMLLEEIKVARRDLKEFANRDWKKFHAYKREMESVY